ncbi:tetratricopeptide repeat protein [Desulfobulbus oligotrophicus]|uniref:Tetratricopeptide repeat protein n=1 Tax=Desulfobulbus oligotrophicus TaxID=1909699 RepID=A0A7T6AQT8_9BACT|nr:hypothetical protein [Desulfobulbus oligotrophicus]QQG65808.1 hypothetical protein HP555_07995 [Desulfobulbus oligotrophicus]
MKHASCLIPLRLVIAIGTCVLVLAGCAMDGGVVDPYDARARREAAGQQTGAGRTEAEAAQRDVLTPVMSSINSRIRASEKKIEEWKDIEQKTASMSLPQEKLNRIDECRSHLQHILLEYTSLKKQLQEETQVEAAQVFAGTSLLRLNQQDIEYLESGCVKFLTELKAAGQPMVIQPDPQIKAAYENHDYDQVINLYSRIAATPGQVMAAETTYQYGQALLKNYQEVEAKRVFSDLLSGIRSQKGQGELQLYLLQKVADVNFSLESFDEARKQYEELIQLSIEKGASRDEWAGLQLAALQSSALMAPEFKEYIVLLKRHLAFVPKRDGYSVAELADKFLLAYPASTLTANVNLIKRSTREQLDAWLSQGVRRVENQVEERKAADLPVVPDGQGTTAPAPQEKPFIGAAGSAASTPVVDGGGEKNLQEEYDRGVAHLQAREYDKAIECFNRLQHTALEAQARPHMQEASRLAVQDARQKAAELFVRAANSRDTDEKRKLLLSSRDLLQGALVKYPQSGLTDRVQKNLVRIEAELQAVGTGLTPRPVTSGGAYVPSSSGTGGGGGTPPASL